MRIVAVKFEKETMKHDIEQKQLKETELQKKLYELKEYVDASREEEETQMSYLEKSNTQNKNIIRLRDILRYNRNKVKELLNQLTMSK